ncbi:hypothetical protein GCM10011487_35870 [Steroidobacter agaridevorans]|uniref:DUF1203 domain-containing protein n=1 Tax=Steroidobacter agaridevorans TaxID=2695856 RepID=A0A829YE98_9GAMM|nr:DUF1203 domain-containing protein [Steroidobacter agaridevorans]GFE81587.1 hypothetical protein GCM10011487_35870 [Steroidobacter agaridevorans]
MSFQITGLPLSQFSPLFSMSDEELAQQGAIRVTADERPGFPCRVSLQDAEVGEKLLLLNYEHLPVATPYRSRHAIYVREAASEAQLAIDEVPQQMRPRLLSLRAFDADGMMKAADVAPGTAIEKLIEQMFANPSIAFLHVHNAKWGCYAARVDRA